MRKFFALTLAVAMVLSLASVSFAASAVTKERFEGGEIILSNFFKYDGDKNVLTTDDKQYGKSYYALILESTATYTDADDTTKLFDAKEVVDETKTEAGDKKVVSFKPITNYDQVEKLRVKAEFEMGEDLVESVSIVKKNFKNSNAETNYVNDFTFANAQVTTTVETANAGKAFATTGNTVAATNLPVNSLNGYYYFVEIKTKAERVTGDADIIGTFEFNRKAKDDVEEIDEVEVDFNFNLWYEKAYIKSDGTKTEYTVDGSKDIEMKWDDLYVLKFSNDDEVTLNFGTDPNEGEFTVDVSGQGKLVIDFNTKANEAICAANEGVKMHFVNFNGAKFNRTGTFEYEMEDMVAAYKVEGDKLVEIAGLELDGETATFTTRTLGNYVFADAELVNPVAEAPVVEAPAAVTNPSTGA